jgi:hypothetical protein
MTSQEIKDYRKILEKEFSDKDLEIETSLSYISFGALGFFITINEKFVKLMVADYKTILILSLIFLFLSVALVLIRKYRTSHNDLKLIYCLDELKPDSDEDIKLLELWEHSHKELFRIIIVSYCCLGIGIGLQVLFLILNLK